MKHIRFLTFHQELLHLYLFILCMLITIFRLLPILLSSYIYGSRNFMVCKMVLGRAQMYPFQFSMSWSSSDVSISTFYELVSFETRPNFISFSLLYCTVNWVVFPFSCTMPEEIISLTQLRLPCSHYSWFLSLFLSTTGATITWNACHCNLLRYSFLTDSL